MIIKETPSLSNPDALIKEVLKRLSKINKVPRGLAAAVRGAITNCTFFHGKSDTWTANGPYRVSCEVIYVKDLKRPKGRDGYYAYSIGLYKDLEQTNWVDFKRHSR